MAKRAPRQVNPAAERRPGRPPAYQPTVLWPFSALYLHATNVPREDIWRVLRVWVDVKKRHRKPAPARQWRREARSVRGASEKIQSVLNRWVEFGETEPAHALFVEITAKLQKLDRIASYLGRSRSGPADVLRRGDEKLRFATMVAQVEPVLGLTLRVRQVVALAVLAGVQEPTRNDQPAAHRVLQNWERTWKTARRLAAALRRGRTELSKQVPASPRAVVSGETQV